ncbi:MULTISPECIES: MmgE/PrpD family protein [unclassified Acidiplasma]|uniref:MmgE/PrpD family protein n=1 Tax=unclassified Acidiplasma TaxID=2641301 RepID=UPI0005E1E303|nr:MULTISPECIES: MmgE/PrpD family protein [unclassified Acidiplasma]KJE49213.1 2-methylcitrate dehydratase [Acidiplasma sp. MBA-1]WMT54829.1 MAG: MmgE/PrpD family protein [Acidiplasma sp.]
MNIEEELADFISNTKYNDLAADVKHEVKRRFIDSLGVAYSSMDSQPALKFKKLSGLYPGNAKMIGLNTASPDYSAFYNSLIIRYMDFNDTYLSLEPLHPSDIFGSLISLGSMFHKTGKDLITAAAVGYEIGARFCDSATLRKKGYDHVNYTEIAMAAALSNMMNFDVDQTINTISISLVPHIALRQTRVGELSMWKAGAAANSARNSIFAALATLYGFTSPREPISGKMGFKNIIVPDLAEDALRKKSSDAIMRTYIKKYPVEYHAQAAVEAALKLANEIDVNRIDSVEIETYEAAVTILADPEKWSPENKETADHSLPFIVASTLLNKDFWTNNYSDIRNENAKSLMKKIKVTEIPEYTKMYPESLPVKIKIKCGDKKYESEVIIPRGHYKNPMDDREVETKFIRLTGMVSAVRDLWNMEDKEVENLV